MVQTDSSSEITIEFKTTTLLKYPIGFRMSFPVLKLSSRDVSTTLDNNH